MKKKAFILQFVLCCLVFTTTILAEEELELSVYKGECETIEHCIEKIWSLEKVDDNQIVSVTDNLRNKETLLINKLVDFDQEAVARVLPLLNHKMKLHVELQCLFYMMFKALTINIS